jgi:hypothetical protein
VRLLHFGAALPSARSTSGHADGEDGKQCAQHDGKQLAVDLESHDCVVSIGTSDRGSWHPNLLVLAVDVSLAAPSGARHKLSPWLESS